MKITENTRVSGVRRVGRYTPRAFLAGFLTVIAAARVQRAPLDAFLDIPEKAVNGAG
ncbi:MAG: hypothetical protein GXP40_10910 [Chloroflexi bacterium]|nr:hypothetical protein [Chloroflexota bacterium]